MEIKQKKVPIYETKKILKSHNKINVYVANDGKEFHTEEQCTKYEASLILLEEANKNVNKIYFSEYDAVVCEVVFEGYGDIEVDGFYKLTIDKTNGLQNSYLMRLGCANAYSELAKYENGDEILICSYTQNANTDYPSYYIDSIFFKDFETKIADFAKTIISYAKV